MNRKFEIVLDECLDWLQAGASVEDCLARYPEHTEALGPLLSLASAVRTVPYPRSKPAAMVAGRQMMLRAVAEKKARQPFPGGLRARSLARVALSFAVLILVVGLSARGFVAVAADSLPGDNLYPVKRFAENVRLALTSDPVARQQLQSEFAQEREEEVRAVLDSDRAATVEFSGFLQELGDRFWRVSGLRISLNAQTVVVGQPVVGSMVLVRAWSAGDGTLLAVRLEVQSSSVPATRTTTATPDPTSTPTPTRTPMPTPTRLGATSTATLWPTLTPAPTTAASPTPTPTGEREPTVTEEPEPTETEEPEVTREPEPAETEGPEPPDEPEPNETDEPESTGEPEPNETDEPESSGEPDDGPEPAETEEPVLTPEPSPADDD